MDQNISGTAYDKQNPDHIAMMGRFVIRITAMIAAGKELEAKSIYNEQQMLFGFKDADFGKFTSFVGLGGNYGYSGEQVKEWAANPGTSPLDAEGGVGGAGTQESVMASMQPAGQTQAKLNPQLGQPAADNAEGS